MTPQFEIAFTEDHGMDEGIPFRGLRLTLRNYAEQEGADLTFWSTKDHENQGLTELNHLMASRNKGALIVSIPDPANAFRVWTWTMGKKDDHVLFQDRLLFILEGSLTSNPACVSEYIGEYPSHNEDGDGISEWTVPIASIRNFAKERSSH
jgi:hypothetical protein